MPFAPDALLLVRGDESVRIVVLSTSLLVVISGPRRVEESYRFDSVDALQDFRAMEVQRLTSEGWMLYSPPERRRELQEPLGPERRREVRYVTRS